MAPNARTVLVVEDEAADRVLLQELLAAEGLSAILAADGAAALAALAEGLPALAIVDILLPGGMDGFELVHRLKSDPRSRQVPVIIVTALQEREARLRGLDVGAEEFICKPVDRAEFTARVRNLLKLKEYQDFLAEHNRLLEEQVKERTAALTAEVDERKRAQEQLDRAAQRLHLATESALIGIWDLDLENNMLIWDERMYALYGIRPQDFGGAYEAWEQGVHPDDLPAARAEAQAAIAGTRDLHTQFRVLWPDGQVRHIEAHAAVRRGPAGTPKHMIGVNWDITERKRAETNIRHLNRLYALLSGINKLIVRTSDRDELFLEFCRIAVEDGKFLLAWIGLPDREAMRVNPVSWYGVDEHYVRSMPLALDPARAEQYGLAGRAVAERKAQNVYDIAEDKHYALKQEALEYGFKSLAILPILVAGEVAAVFALYAGEAEFFETEGMELLHELAGDIAFALDHIEKARRLDYLAFYDPLTGLANRTLFVDRLSQYMHAASLAGDQLALVLIDLDRFRRVNESLGRPAGDELLKQLAERLARGTGAGELARISADMFAIVLLALTGKSEAMRRIEHLWQVCLSEPFRLRDDEHRLSAKAGVALFPGDAGNAETLLVNAEAALRKAKKTGERHVFYSLELTASTGGQLAFENQLRQALDQGEFVLHYQPKVDFDTRHITGVEALIRWQSPELGLVPPVRFIPLLEETGLIVEVGAWVLGRAIADHQRWTKLELLAPRIAVNVSAVQLRRHDFVTMIQEALKLGARSTGIDLEITETLIMEDIQGNIEKLKTLRELGMHIAIDDFGTGYSSLGYLARLPVNTLKIDRSFVIAMLDDSNAMTLVSTIISLAHSLRLNVVAEGVETEEQAKMLRLLRCDQMQGYLFSRPVPFEQMTALLPPRIG